MKATHTVIISSVGIGVLLSCIIAYTIYTNTMNSSREEGVPIVMRSVGPLELGTTYPEIQSSKNITEGSRLKVNQWFKDNTIPCFYKDYVTKDFLINELNRNAQYDEKIKKTLSSTDLQKMNIDEMRRFYIQIKQSEFNSQYNIDINKNKILTGTHFMGGSFCGWEPHPGKSVDNFVLDLKTGREVTIGDIVTVDEKFLTFVQQKINQEYVAGGSDIEDNQCMQYIKESYLVSYGDDGSIIFGDGLNQETSFSLSTSTLSIIPTGYPSAIEGPCGGTLIDFSYSELSQFLKKGSIVERLR
jgi:hypothetical protein